MRTKLLNLLLLAALALAGSRLARLLREPPPALPVPPAATGEAAAPATPAAATPPAEAPAAARPEGYDVIVARDLFSPTRGVIAPAPSIAPAVAPKVQPPPKLTLYGVVIVDGEKSAYLVEGGQDARPKKVRENERFAGGVVSAIRPDGLTFQFGGADIAVPLRSPKEGIAAAAPLAPPQPATPLQPQPARSVVPQPRRPGQPGAPPVQIPSPLSRVPPGAVPRVPVAAPPDAGASVEEAYPDNPFGEEGLGEGVEEEIAE